MGMRQIVETSEDYARFECPDGDSAFSVHRSDRAREVSGTVVYFECDELDATVSELKARGIVFDSDPEDQRWLWREARLHDPDGNTLCLYHAGSNRHNPPWRMP